MAGFEDGELSQTSGFPTSRRQLFDKLQVKLAVFNDRIEVNSLFPFRRGSALLTVKFVIDLVKSRTHQTSTG